MAILTTTDYTYIKNWIKTQPLINTEFELWSLPRSTWKALFQQSEDYEVNAFNNTPLTSYKESLELIHTPITSTRAQYIFMAWVSWKLYNHLGG